MEEDPFEGFSDLSEDDFNTIARATQFMGLNFSNCSAPKETPSELAHLRGDSMQTRHRVEFLERTLRQLQQEKQTKEGEVSILRDRLGRVECEKNTALMKTCERLRESEQARRSIEEEYRRSLENLKVELAFKSQEIDSLCQRLECFNLQKNAQAEAGSKAPKLNSQPAKDMVLVPAGFEDFNQKKRMAPLYKNEEVFVAEKLSLPMPPNTEPLLCFQSERALLDEAVACVEYEWDITKLMEYDYKEILVRKGDLHKHLARIGDLAAALELSYDECLGNLREIVFLYCSHVIATCLILNESIALLIYSESCPSTQRQPSRLLSKMCKLLTNSPFGLSPAMFKVHLDMLHSILAHAKAAVPLDIKELLESGCLHRCIENMLDRDDVLVSLIRFMDSISIDRSAVGLLLKQFPTQAQSSLMAQVVKVGIECFQGSIEKDDNVPINLVKFLWGLARRNLVPMHVAFDWRLLYELVDYMLRLSLSSFEMLEKRQSSLALYLEVLHYVVVERAYELGPNLEGNVFSLHFVGLRLVERLEGCPKHYLLGLLKATESEVEAWIKRRDADRIEQSSIETLSISL